MHVDDDVMPANRWAEKEVEAPARLRLVVQGPLHPLRTGVKSS